MAKLRRKTLTDDERFQKWHTELKYIKDDTQCLVTDLWFWDEFTRMVNASPIRDEESAFWPWLMHCFFEAKAIQIRRICEREKKDKEKSDAKAEDTISLHMLLSEIRDCPGVLSIDRLRKKHRDEELIGNFEDRYGKGLRCLPQVVQQDIRCLERASDRLRIWLNNFIAHRSRKPKVAPSLPIEVIRSAKEEISRVVGEYGRLLTGTDPGLRRIPICQWQSIFWKAWAKPPG